MADTIHARMNGSERKPAKTRKVPSGVEAPFSSLTTMPSVWPSGNVQVPRWMGFWPDAPRSRVSNRTLKRISGSEVTNFVASPKPFTFARRTTIEWVIAFENIASRPQVGKTFAASTVRAGFSGLVKANRSVKSAAGSPICLGPSMWSDIARLRCQPAQLHNSAARPFQLLRHRGRLLRLLRLVRFRRTAEWRDAARLFRNGLQVFNERPALILGQ